jgi:hypothetical protein
MHPTWCARRRAVGGALSGMALRAQTTASYVMPGGSHCAMSTRRQPTSGEVDMQLFTCEPARLEHMDSAFRPLVTETQSRARYRGAAQCGEQPTCSCWYSISSSHRCGGSTRRTVKNTELRTVLLPPTQWSLRRRGWCNPRFELW